MGRTELRCLSAAAGLVIAAAASVAVAAQVQTESRSACVGCHAAQTIHQAETPMGQAMLLPGSNLTLKARPTLSLRKGVYIYTIETKGNQSTYTVRDSTRKESLPIHWTFG